MKRKPHHVTKVAREGSHNRFVAVQLAQGFGAQGQLVPFRSFLPS